MKTAVRISIVLSWINMIAWGFIFLLGMLGTLVSQNFTLLLGLFLTSSVLLHSYAAMQFNKSLNYPEIPLTQRTISGLRFMGYGALLTGFFIISDAITSLRHIPEIAKLAQLPEQFKNVDLNGAYRIVFLFLLLLGISMVANVFITLRLLRWYLLNSQKEQKD